MVLGSQVLTEASIEKQYRNLPQKIQKTPMKFCKIRAKYPTCKGGDESPCAEGTII